MKQWGYGAGYQHAHQFEDAINTMECLPESLQGTIFYEPTDRGVEQRIAARLAEIRAKKAGGQRPGSRTGITASKRRRFMKLLREFLSYAAYCIVLTVGGDGVCNNLARFLSGIPQINSSCQATEPADTPPVGRFQLLTGSNRHLNMRPARKRRDPNCGPSRLRIGKRVDVNSIHPLEHAHIGQINLH